MTVLTKLASQLNRKDERPNVELARELMEANNVEGIQEIVENLSNQNRKIKYDCIKIAYEIGRFKPELISDYTEIFIQILGSPNNRLASGSMRVLSTVAEISAIPLMKNLDLIKEAIKTGSAITAEKGILTLTKLAALNEHNQKIIIPYLIHHLRTCRIKVVPQHAEIALSAITYETKDIFFNTLAERLPYLTKPQARRIHKILRSLALLKEETKELML